MSAGAVVMLSGGAGSWLAARRWIDQHGPNGVTLLFADTRNEDADLYRFLEDASVNLGLPVTQVADGRTPFEVFRDERYLGNSQIAPCSKHLKQIPSRRWVEQHTDPRETVIVIGVGAWEGKRVGPIEAAYHPWTVVAPLLDPPAPTQQQVLEAVTAAGLKSPRLYGLGFKHNNCGGVCVRGGFGQWGTLLRVFPSRYAHAEAQEQGLREQLGDVAILKHRSGRLEGQPLTLADYRARLESQPSLFDEIPPDDDPGGCGITGCGVQA
jgi:hypothetical protein